MNQKLLGAARGIGALVLFSILTALIGDIAPVLAQIPGVGAFITPSISATLTAVAFAYEHTLANKYGYNLPVGSIAVQK